MRAPLEAFRQRLRELGWIEGQTVTIEYRWVDGNPQRVQALAADLVQLKVDLIVTTGTQAIRVVKETTRTIPVVFVGLPRQLALAVYTDRPRLFEKLWAIPGVRRHQTGDHEMRPYSHRRHWSRLPASSGPIGNAPCRPRWPGN